MMSSISEDNLIHSLNIELKNMKNCCVSTDYTTAVINNHVQCLEKIHDTFIRIPWNSKTMEIAVENGSIDCLKYLYENGCPVNNDICDYAAQAGHVECLIYLHKVGIKPTSKTCFYAVYNCHIKCIEYLIQNGCAPIFEF